jgi:hypothetical protein
VNVKLSTVALWVGLVAVAVAAAFFVFARL